MSLFSFKTAERQLTSFEDFAQINLNSTQGLSLALVDRDSPCHKWSITVERQEEKTYKPES